MCCFLALNIYIYIHVDEYMHEYHGPPKIKHGKTPFCCCFCFYIYHTANVEMGFFFMTTLSASPGFGAWVVATCNSNSLTTKFEKEVLVALWDLKLRSNSWHGHCDMTGQGLAFFFATSLDLSS